MAGIDRRVAGGEQRQQRRLRPLQIEGGLIVAVDRHVVDLVVPGLSRVLPEFLRRLAHQHVEGAFDVGRGERLAIVPFDVMSKLEGERLVVAAPGPAFRQLGADGVDAVLRDVLIENDQIVIDRHEGNVERIGRALMDRGAARAVAVIHSQDAARFWPFGERYIVSRKPTQRCDGKRFHAPHGFPSGLFGLMADWRRRYHGMPPGQLPWSARGLAIRDDCRRLRHSVCRAR